MTRAMTAMREEQGSGRKVSKQERGNNHLGECDFRG